MDPLLHRHHVDRTDVRCAGEQLVGHLAQRRRNLTIEMRLPARVVVEGVENPVRGVADLERVPGHRARLRSGEIAPTFQELPQVLTLARLGLEQVRAPRMSDSSSTPSQDVPTVRIQTTDW